MEAEPYKVLHHDLGYVEAGCSGFVEEQKFRQWGETILRFAQQKGVSRLLIDLQDLKVLRPGNQIFIREEWFPEALERGISRFAILEPTNFFGNASVKQAVDLAPELFEKVEFEYFLQREAAEDWLLGK
ncbi:hypothetical protein [Persicobacter sp. CCB-QB2]|uniref:hypothetical protein n=1 Tax=Persicobacter sp. CCB-QB2 TaxID=1561025 RepID=UPI0006A9C43B|nr:hypothetical protein [Persicobacter sp. CCB-QB2]